MATALELLAPWAMTAAPGDSVVLSDSTGREWTVTFGERTQPSEDHLIFGVPAQSVDQYEFSAPPVTR